MYYSRQLANEKVKHGKNKKRWKGPLATEICLAENTEINVDNLIPQDIQGLDSFDGLLLDLNMIKDENNTIHCQTDIPSKILMNQELCQKTLNLVSQILAIPVSEISNLNLDSGINAIYATLAGPTNLEPRNIVCRERDTSTATLAGILDQEVLNILQEVRILDSALGTKFMEKLDKLSQDCDHENLKTLMESELKPSEIDKCFKLGISTAGGRYKRDMNLINMGAGGGDDAQMTDQVNKNFKLLSRNEKELFRRLVSLGVEKDLETEILEDHSQNLKLFDNRLRGLEQSSNILTYHRDFLQHILQASNHSFQLMDKLFQRIKNMERYISLVLEARDTVCIDLTCFDSKGIHLSVNSQGLALFIKGNMLSAQAGVTPSCSMNSRQEISIHHMKHMSVLNSTHLQDGDYKVKIECLSDYALCSKEENIRHINKNDLIEGNLLLSPGKKGSFKIQCIEPKVLSTPEGFIRCTQEVKVVSLPLTLPSGVTIGMQDIKVTPYNSPLTTLREVGLNLFKSSSMKLNEMKTLAHATWEHLTDVSEVNTSHLSVGLGLLITFVSVACCMICCQCSLFDIPKWCKAKREGHTTDWSSVKFWKKKTSSNATDDVELESVDSKESPKAGPSRAGASAPEVRIITPEVGPKPAGKPKIYLDLGSFTRAPTSQ